MANTCVGVQTVSVYEKIITFLLSYCEALLNINGRNFRNKTKRYCSMVESIN